jgi:hypothetical protein
VCGSGTAVPLSMIKWVGVKLHLIRRSIYVAMCSLTLVHILTRGFDDDDDDNSFFFVVYVEVDFIPFRAYSSSGSLSSLDFHSSYYYD